MASILVLIGTALLLTVTAKKPNILLVLTDDQDIVMGSVTPMKQVQKMVANEGATFSNAFVSTPICCPSRSSILTGLYQHNHGCLNNSIEGGCNGLDWQQSLEPSTFANILHKAGYRTFYAGKYLNTYGYPKVGGTRHVPLGWDSWIGLKGNSRYYNYTLSVNGTAKTFPNQYLTNVIQKFSVEFVESMRFSNDSFLMVLATPAPHTPYTPEPKYKGTYKGIKVPRTPNFNPPKLKNRHWLLNMEPEPLPEKTVQYIDSYHAKRWETLRSVDDMVAATINKLKDIGQLENTYIIFTSDHGYHLGQFGLPWDKRQPYETDIRVPLFVRGPGIKPKILLNTPVVNIDIAPTIVDMAGLHDNTHMDGWSFLQYAAQKPQRPPHDHFLLEYSGEGDSSTVSKKCPLIRDDTLSECYPLSSCKCQDSRNNTYSCVRKIDAKENDLYCEFYEGVKIHKEFFNINQDPYQLDNTYESLSPAGKAQIKTKLDSLKKCKNTSCRSL